MYWGKHEEHFVKGFRDVLDTVTFHFGKTHLRKFYFIYFFEGGGGIFPGQME